MSAGLAEGQRRSYMGDGSLREPSPIRQGIGGRAVKDKNRNPEGTPDFFPGRCSSCAGTWQKNKFTICKYCWMNRAGFTIITNRNRALRPHGHPP
ncbi:hypothetical protein BZU47_21190 [Salmonella enterica subsp. enterica serovar Enteritidis]|nr:hypothetical protein [Salmonella enterica subsp. enterica serovar Enteritidis]